MTQAAGYINRILCGYFHAILHYHRYCCVLQTVMSVWIRTLNVKMVEHAWTNSMASHVTARKALKENSVKQVCPLSMLVLLRSSGS